MEDGKIDKGTVLTFLNGILEVELAGVVRYTHYSLMVFGFNRIPIVTWLRESARWSLAQAEEAGEWVTALGGHPSLAVGPLLENHKHSIGDLLEESLDLEMLGQDLYRQLFALVKYRHLALDGFARARLCRGERHLAEMRKMLRSPQA